jgi:hypothetical protein
VSEPRERLFEMFLQCKACVVGTDRNSHGKQLYYVCSTFVVRRSTFWFVVLRSTFRFVVP